MVTSLSTLLPTLAVNGGVKPWGRSAVVIYTAWPWRVG